MSVSKTIIKSITAKEVFNKHYYYIKKELYGGNLWTSGYYVNTVGEYANREINYVRNQGQKEKDYKQLYSVQLDFDFGKEFI